MSRLLVRVAVTAVPPSTLILIGIGLDGDLGARRSTVETSSRTAARSCVP
jgi:hypothetical protein